MATEDAYRRLAFSLPEVIEELYYGSPSFKVGKKFFSRLREDGENVVVLMDREERDFWMAQEPDLFHVTPHYQNSNAVLVRLSVVQESRLEQLLRNSWLRAATPAIRKLHPEVHA